MKKSSGWMKILIVLPVILLVCLLAIMTLDWWNINHGTRQADTNVVRAAVETENPAVETETMAGDTGAVSDTDLQKDFKISEDSLGEEEGLGAVKQTEQQDSAVHLVFAGDILLSSHVTSAYDKAGGIEGVLDDGFRSVISQSDIFMANEEFPFSDRGSAAADKQFTFRLPPSKVSILQELQLDIVALANNHALDFGTDALVDTYNTLDQAGIRYVGAGPDMNRARQLEVMEVRGRRIGFLAASRVFPSGDWVAGSSRPGMVSGYDPAILLEEIKKAEDFCDYLVIYVHWGIERDDRPQEYQRTLGKQLIDAGADLVVGSHPHVLQGIEYYNGKPIVYSLGNFVFGSSIPKTALLKADVNLDTDQVSLSIVPGTSGAGYTKVISDPGKLQEFYGYMQGISFGAQVDENGNVRPEE